MTSKEFILWLKGFTEGVHEFNITPKQWDYLKEKLAEVDDNTIPMGGVIVDHNTFRVPNTAPIQTLPFIQPYDPYNPYKITCQQPDTNGTTITTTPNVGGSITIANPPFGFGSTSTAYTYPSGSAWSYTNNTYNPPYTTQTNNDLKANKKFKKRKAKSVKEWEDTHDLGGEE
jgi:hypothetical protein